MKPKAAGKKDKAKKTAKKSTKKTKRALDLSGKIVIKAGNYIVDPEPFETAAGGVAIWTVDNQDAEEHIVTIDPLQFYNKTDNVKGDHPFKKDSELSAKALPQIPTAIIGFVKDKLKHRTTSYKYEIRSRSADKKLTRSLDPDLDVIDPN